MIEQKIIPTLIEKEMKTSYLDYSMSVIVGRALPDARDGLKPVHRRILYAMLQTGMLHNKPFKKCARIVGEVLGKYHPHGDVSVYDALVRMAQDFSLRYPLVQGQGNMGSIDGDPPAAMRYTEAKLKKIAEQILQDIEKDTVEFVPNFDDSTKEPCVLPSKLPNLLINGSSGIAVGMATNIPPHNVNEICDAIINLIDNDLSDNELMNFVKGPDFPTGGIISGTNGIRLAYKTGKGKIVVKSKTKIENNKIIIGEIPYQVNKSYLLEHIADLVKEKVIDGISDLRDESDRNGMRIVIELKKGYDSNVVLNQLYKHSSLQTTFGIMNIALVDGEPKILSLKDMCLEFIKHRKEIIVRRTKYDLKKAEERAHILQGILIALKSIDQIIALIKSSKDVSEAMDRLIGNYGLTEKQADAILDIKLQKLAALEQQKLLDEHNELIKFIQEMKEILGSVARVNGLIKDELIGIKNEFGDERRTEIIEGEGDNIEVEDLIEKEDAVVTITHSGYIKRQLLDTYKSQKRGGKGVIGATTKDEDFVENIFVANTHSHILFFTDKGNVHWLKTYKIPEAGRYARGTAVVNLVRIEKDEKITSTVAVNEFRENLYLIMATKNGIVKKTSLKEYSRPRQGGIIGINLRGGDKLVDVKLTNGTKQIMLATKDGRAVRFKEENIKPVARNSIGVRGINARTSEVIGMVVIDAPYLLTVTEKGYGKRSNVNDYRLISRGGSGVTNIKITDKNGNVVGVKCVNDNYEIMLISKNGVIIRTPVKGISVIGRNTQGVRIMNLGLDDKLATVARIINEDKDIESHVEEDNFMPSEDEENLTGEMETVDDGFEAIKDELKKENIGIIDEDNQENKDLSSQNIIDETKEKENPKRDNSNKIDFTLDGY